VKLAVTIPDTVAVITVVPASRAETVPFDEIDATAEFELVQETLFGCALYGETVEVRA
jgi:hypothetical protein